MSLTPTTADRLRNMLKKDGPYLTAYFDVIDAGPEEHWNSMRPAVLRRDVPQALVDAVDARVGLPSEDDIGGWGIIASADGSTEVFTSPDAPRRPVVRLASIPYMAPALEWEHRNVPHVVLIVSAAGYEVVPFVQGQKSAVIDAGNDLADVLKILTGMVDEHGVQLVVIGGDEALSYESATRIRAELPPSALVDVVSAEDAASTDEFADAVVRAVSNLHATETVNALREFRFERTHDKTIEGASNVLDSIREHEIRTLLIHDDPDDQRMVARSESADAWTISAVDPSDTDVETVRLVDYLIASALLHDADVRVIPTTGSTGPKGDMAVIIEDVSAGL